VSPSRRLPASVEKALLVGLGVVAVVAAMTPLAPGGGMVAPDLLYAVIVAWVIRRPAATPLWAVLALGLFADVMLSRPIGLGALGLLFASEFFRGRAATFHGVPFPLEWLAAAVVFAAMLAAIQLALMVVAAGPPGAGPLARHFVATVLAYPLVVLGLTWCLRLRAPQAQRFGDPLGRLQ
jgi:rod shape-determining protein MreD